MITMHRYCHRIDRLLDDINFALASVREDNMGHLNTSNYLGILNFVRPIMTDSIGHGNEIHFPGPSHELHCLQNQFSKLEKDRIAKKLSSMDWKLEEEGSLIEALRGGSDATGRRIELVSFVSSRPRILNIDRSDSVNYVPLDYAARAASQHRGGRPNAHCRRRRVLQHETRIADGLLCLSLSNGRSCPWLETATQGNRSPNFLLCGWTLQRLVREGPYQLNLYRTPFC